MPHHIKTKPTTIVIFGVTGDLAGKKIIPALFDLYAQNMLPEQFHIVGFSRRDWTNKKFNEYLAQLIKRTKKKVSQNKIDDFLKNTCFQGGTFDDLDAYRALGQKTLEVDEAMGGCANKLFYLAAPPAHYETIFKHLARSGLTIPCGGAEGWTRVLVEKPFGKDSATAMRLDTLMSQLFREEQIFRIDHYLAKETLQNILAFRFSNTLFEPIWNRDHIDRVEIKLLEKDRITERGEFYDQNGALRDVGQNHILQMLALIAMEDPGELNSAAVRAERAAVLRSLVPLKTKEITDRTIKAQYKGYTSEKKIKRGSKTETYFKTITHINNKRWKGVPFVLESGKALGKELTEISVYFKQKMTCVCELQSDQILQNVLTFSIKPKEGIAALFWAKKPGFTMEVEPRELSFNYRAPKNNTRPHDAYEQVLYDCIRGEQMLFASTEEVKAAWEFITPILENWESIPLHLYRPGTKPPII